MNLQRAKSGIQEGLEEVREGKKLNNDIIISKLEEIIKNNGKQDKNADEEVRKEYLCLYHLFANTSKKR